MGAGLIKLNNNLIYCVLQVLSIHVRLIRTSFEVDSNSIESGPLNEAWGLVRMAWLRAEALGSQLRV